MSLIAKKQEIFEIDYRQQPLPLVFVDTNNDIEPMNYDWFKPFKVDALIDFIQQARSTLLLAMDILDNQQVINALQRKADQGLRVFLCLGTEHSNTSAIDQLQSRCLLRTGTRQQGALIIRDQNTLQKSGCLLTGALTDEAYQILLDKRQVDDSYRSFCHLFWQECDKEFSINSTKKAQSINSSIVVNHSYQSKNGLNRYFDIEPYSAFNTLVSSDDKLLQQLSPKSDSRSFALLSVDQSALAEKVIEQQGQVSLTEKSLPNLVQVKQTYWLLPQSVNTAQSNWALQLNDQQVTDIDLWVYFNYRQAKWQLDKKSNIGQLQSRTVKFAADIKQSFICKEHRERVISPIYTHCFDDFFNTDIKVLAKEQTGWIKEQLASVIQYTVERHPPYFPDSAKEDALHRQWSLAQNQWKKIVDEQLAKLANLEQQQSSVAELIRQFIGQFVLGQKQQNKKLKQQLEAFAEWDCLHATHAERSEKLQALQGIAIAIANNKQRTEQEISNAEAQRKWNEKKIKLNQTVLDAETQVGTSKSNIDKHALQLVEQQTQNEQAALLELEQLVSSLVEAERTKLPSDLSQVELEKFFANKVKRKNFPSLHQVFIRTKKKNNELRGKLNELDARLMDAEKQLTNAREQLLAYGNYFIAPVVSQDHLSQQLRLEENKDLEINWPTEQLPQNGLQLMREGNQRYLVVVDVSQFQDAQVDAERLKAKLCAPGNRG
ncbi:hypothetical protein [Neptunomonas qingdaonensis]|uniref:PLD-like domain-containing protein n=1 Tax=Neptunomonas qingdaonensis TaxID=1045558 RepID=A0A1I2TTE0_9GAMM|nr:hypothetical protein [Neptunomonas qingdaonensis]SFG68120.1 hypothetical protein SAMN05216175_1118 [Neptunomonas qingdaonensis]